MTNLTTLRTAKHASLTGAEWWEVVGQHPPTELLLSTGVVDALGVHLHSESSRHEGLSLSTGEERRAVGVGGLRDAAVDEANLIGRATVDACAGREDLLPHDLSDQLVPGFLGLARLGVDHVGVSLTIKELLDDGIARSLEGHLALVLAGDAHGLGEAVGAVGCDKLDDVSIQLGCGWHLCLLDARDGLELFDCADDLLDLLVREVHGVHHGVLGHLVGAALDHADRVDGSRHDQVELGLFHLSAARVGDECAVDLAHANTSDGALERCVRDVEGCRCAAHGERVRVTAFVVRQDSTDHLSLVAVVLRELRANRAVDHPRDERLALVGATLALEVVAGDGAVGAVAILVLHCERQEVEAGRATGHGGHENSRVVHADHDGAVGLLGHHASLKSHVTSADFDRYGFKFHWNLQIHGWRERPSIGSSPRAGFFVGDVAHECAVPQSRTGLRRSWSSFP